MKYVYETKDTCNAGIELDVENDIVKGVTFWGGCNGNLRDISRLVTRISILGVITRLEGVRCGTRSISYPDQLRRVSHEMGS